MGYLDDVRRVATTHREELEGDLDQAKHSYQRASQNAADLGRQIETMEALLALLDDRDQKPATGTMTLHDAMCEVIREAPLQMLRASDIASEINRRRLYRMRDGRSVESQQIHARVGHYPRLFRREGTFIKLVES